MNAIVVNLLIHKGIALHLADKCTELIKELALEANSHTNRNDELRKM